MKKKDFYSVLDAAKLCDCHPETIRRAIRDGTLIARRYGRSYRIRSEELERYSLGTVGKPLFSDEESGRYYDLLGLILERAGIAETDEDFWSVMIDLFSLPAPDEHRFQIAVREIGPGLLVFWGFPDGRTQIFALHKKQLTKELEQRLREISPIWSEVAARAMKSLWGEKK